MVNQSPAATNAPANQGSGAVAVPPEDDARSRALRAQLARTTDRYLQWRMAQQRDIQAREMALERLKAEIDQRVMQQARAAAAGISQMEGAIAAYAAAIQRAMTYTENPWSGRRDTTAGIGPAPPPTPRLQPLRLPGG